MNETIGNRISKHRREKRMTQEELAEKLGVSSQAVSKWENDQSCPDISLLPTLCRIFGISTDELLTGRNDEVRMIPSEQRKSLDELILRVRVNSAAGDKVKVNLPMSLVKVCLELGICVTPQMNGIEGLQNLDLGKIMELAERGMIGKLVEMESANGDTVEIVVE